MFIVRNVCPNLDRSYKEIILKIDCIEDEILPRILISCHKLSTPYDQYYLSLK